MKRMLKMAVAVLVILAAGYWAFTTAMPTTYSGSGIMFPVGSGHVVVTNPGNEAIPIEMRSGERATSFRIASPELGISQSAKRVGTGRTAYYATEFELPPGQARIDVVSGTGVRLVSRSDTRIEASVVASAANTVRWVLIFSGLAIAWALYYLSKLTGHSWLTALRSRRSTAALQPKQTTT